MPGKNPFSSFLRADKAVSATCFYTNCIKVKKLIDNLGPSKGKIEHISVCTAHYFKSGRLGAVGPHYCDKKDKVVFYLCFAVRSILFLFSSRKHKLPRTKKRRAVNNACKPKYEKKNLIIKSSPLAQIFILYYSCLISLRVNFTILILFSLFSLWHNSENKIMLNSVPEERTDK